MHYMAEWAASGSSVRQVETVRLSPKLTHSQSQTLPIAALLEPQANNQGLTYTTVILSEIVGCYVGLVWELGDYLGGSD